MLTSKVFHYGLQMLVTLVDVLCHPCVGPREIRAFTAAIANSDPYPSPGCHSYLRSELAHPNADKRLLQSLELFIHKCPLWGRELLVFAVDF